MINFINYIALEKEYMSHIFKIQTLIQMIFKVMYKAKYVILKHEHILKSKEFFFFHMSYWWEFIYHTGYLLQLAFAV